MVYMYTNICVYIYMYMCVYIYIYIYEWWDGIDFPQRALQSAVHPHFHMCYQKGAAVLHRNGFHHGDGS